MTWQGFISRLIFIFIITVVMVIIIFQLLYSKIVFYPYKEHFWKPNVKYHDVYLDESGHHGPDGEVHGWFFNDFNESSTERIVVLFCHANAGNISHRDYIIEICRRQKLNLMLFDYRGYGKSRGVHTTDNIMKDGQAAYNFLRKEQGYSPREIIIWGESLGGTVAVHTAAYNRCAYLLLMATFSSLDDIILDRNVSRMAKVATKIVLPFVDNLPSKNHIVHVKCPVVFVHSVEDDLVPYESAIKMYHSVSHNDKRFITIKGKHASPNISSEDMKEILLFCHLDPEVDHSDVLEHLKSYMEKPHIRDNGGMYHPGEIKHKVTIEPAMDSLDLEVPRIHKRRLGLLKSSLE